LLNKTIHNVDFESVSLTGSFITTPPIKMMTWSFAQRPRRRHNRRLRL